MTEREGFVYDYGDTRYRTEMQYCILYQTNQKPRSLSWARNRKGQQKGGKEPFRPLYNIHRLVTPF